MKAIYLDCFSGISGNMLLGAFLQAGVPLEYLTNQLSKLSMSHEFNIIANDVSKCGIASCYVEVELKHGNSAEELHEHHGHHEGHAHHHHHRSWRDIREIINEAELSDNVKDLSCNIFEKIAIVEGKVHGTSPDEVHFHEVGAVDSIVDIVGTAICLDYLNVENVFVSMVNTGSGMVKCAHGMMPVPAPATAELLMGFPTYNNNEGKELTTPTGAGVIKALAEYSQNQPEGFKAEKIAYGAGGWDLDKPNVLRMYLGEYEAENIQSYYQLSTNIDDMNPQIYGYIYDKLLKAGALDVWTTPIFMKKNRPANMLSVLVTEDKKEVCCSIIIEETSSLGIRVQKLDKRIAAERQLINVDTPYGAVSCKAAFYNGKLVNVSAEYEECAAIASEKNIPLKNIQREAVAGAMKRLEENGLD